MKRRIAVISYVLIALLAPARVRTGLPTAYAQQPNLVGLVVTHGDGRTLTRCVEFSEPEISGYDVLIGSGLSVVSDPYPGTGLAVCAIDGEGCPAGNCFCQCQGSPCIYWAYYRLKDGQWEYSGLGASSYAVHSGDVQGWAWGEGGTQGGAEPPLIPFDEICAPPPTDTPTATATWTSSPTPTRTPSPTATWTPVPTSTPTARRQAPTATRTPTDTPGPTSTSEPTVTTVPSTVPTATSTATRIPTATRTPTDTPGPTSTSAPTATMVPSATFTPTPSGTLTGMANPAAPTEKDGGVAASAPVQVTPTPAALPSATTDPTPTPTVARVISIPTSPQRSVLGIRTATPMPTAIPKEARAIAATPTLLAATQRPAAARKQKAVGLTPTPVPPPGAQGGESYLLFGVLAAGLVAGLTVLQVRKRR